MGRATAIAAAGIAGIVSLPALLGSDKPPSVPADVGLVQPPPSAPPPPPLTQAASPAPTAKSRRTRRRQAGRRGPREHPHPLGEHPHPRNHHHAHGVRRTPAASPSPSTASPPVYSYVPPPQPGEFRFER
ncbi:MAG: hypothetical protein WB462_03415 [Solirubrobacterales bacterium]